MKPGQVKQQGARLSLFGSRHRSPRHRVAAEHSRGRGNVNDFEGEDW